MAREARKSTFLTRKNIIIGVVALFFILLICLIRFCLRPNAELIIMTAPSDATIRLNGKKIQSGARKVRAGKHKIELSLGDSETKTYEVEISAGETKSVNLYLSGEDFSYYLKNEEDIDRLALIGDEEALEFVSEYRRAKSITELLPLLVVKDYGEASSKLDLGNDCERSYCLKITDNGEKLKDEMFAKIRSLGYNPEDYEIQYELLGSDEE